MTLTEFLLARIAEDEAVARAVKATRWKAKQKDGTLWIDTGIESMGWSFGGGSGVWNCDDPEDDCEAYRGHAFSESDHIARHDPARVLAECEAKRRIVEWNKAWPVLVEQPPTFECVGDGDLLNSVTFRATQQMAWLTDQEYRIRFRDEPPTGPVLRFLALPYADHPDYREEWRP